MRPPEFPFSALVGLDSLKMALQLAAIDRRLSVLIRGDKGAGKSTAARGLVELLAPGAPFINLPIGATEDRLLGGLDLESAVKGEPALKPGLLAEANGGVLYVDEVNLLPDHLGNALLDAVATGLHVVEREGFSVTGTTDFVLVGSMNPEEGALRPQLLDRFALAVDVTAPTEPAVRRNVVERRLSYDADTSAFCDRWREEQLQLARRLNTARARLLEVSLPGGMLDLIVERIAKHEVRSLRADLAVVRGSRALAALEGAACVTESHVEAVLPLALAHRASHGRRNAPPDSRPPRKDADNPDDASGTDGAASERVFPMRDLPTPRILIDQGSRRGVVTGARQTSEPRELDVRATILHAVTQSGTTRIGRDNLHERLRAPLAGTRYVFVVDSSGSHAIGERMRLVKGAVIGLLDHTTGHRDEVVVVVCRGGAARVLVEPTPVRDDVQRAIEALPTGGRTPLAHALELAARYVTDTTVLVLVTDGHANVATASDDPWADALAAAGALRCPALVIDSEEEQGATGRPRDLAIAMRGTCVRLADLDETSVVRLIREVS